MDAYADGSTLKKKGSRKVDAALNRLYELSQSQNIAEDLDEQKLTSIAKQVIEEFDIDIVSRQQWEDTAKKSMEVALQVRKPKNYPFANASNVKWPLITVAALQFNARCYPEIVSPDGIVGAKVKGKDEGVPKLDPQGQPVVDPQSGEPAWEKEPGAKAAKAERVKSYMDNYIMEEMSGWEEDVDTLTMQLPIVGDVVKKVYPGEDGAVSDMIPAVDFVVNQKTKSLKKCPRMTHRFRLYPHEVEERKADGRYLDEDYDDKSETNDKEAAQEFLEQHRRLDLDDDGYREPYIVTVHKASEKVCRIVANFTAEGVKSNDKRILRITPEAYFVNYVFIPDPEGGFYGIGFGSLLESLGAAIDTTINQMLDAGHLQNSGGGFIGSGVRLKKGIIRRELGVWMNVNASGDILRNAIVPFEDKGPSAVLFNVLGLLIDASKDITAVKDILTGDSPQGETATTTLARIEQGMKVFTAIYKRIYRAGKEELKLIYKYLSEHPDEDAYQTFMDEPGVSMAEDFNLTDYDICPQADPRLVTDMQRLKRAEVLMPFMLPNPDPLVNQAEARRRYFEATGQDDIDGLLVKQEGPSPMEQLQIEGAKATVEKTAAEGKLAEAKTEETMASIGQENDRQHLASLEALDDSTRHDDQMETERVGIVADHLNSDKDRQAMSKKAAESNKAKRPGQTR